MPTPFVGAQSKPRQPLCIAGFHCYTHEHAACGAYNGIEKAIAPQTILNEWQAVLFFLEQSDPLCGIGVWTEDGEVYPVGLPLAVYNTGSIHTRWMITENQTGVGN